MGEADWADELAPFRVTAEPAPPPESSTPRLVRAIDVSGYQPTDLTEIIRETGAKHVVVKLYLPGENVPQEHSSAQIASAWVNRCTVGGYFWLYAKCDARKSVQEALDLAERSGLSLRRLAIDYEPYTDGSMPTVEQLWQAVEECQIRGVQPVIYTADWCWPKGITGFAEAGVPLWAAQYKGGPILGDFDPFGGWTLESGLVWGKQYQGKALDLDVFLPEAV